MKTSNLILLMVTSVFLFYLFVFMIKLAGNIEKNFDNQPKIMISKDAGVSDAETRDSL